MNSKELNCDIKTNNKIAIIGAGPVGLFASYVCGMLGMKCVIFEHREHVGGQCSALYPEKMIYDLPGILGIKAQDLINRLLGQAQAFNATISTNACITKLTHNDHHVFVNETPFKAAIIACGFGACMPNKLVLPNAAKFEEQQIFYNINNTTIFKDKKVVILGGGNSAVDWALHLANIASQVDIVHRRDLFSAFPASVEAMERTPNLHIHNNYILAELIEENNHLTAVKLNSRADTKILQTDYVIACYGLKNDSSALANFGVDIVEGKIWVDQLNNQTSQNRVYAIGDIAFAANKTKLFSILCGFNESVLAANDIYKRFFETDQAKSTKITHSSDMIINFKNNL